jgi:O-antigen/teichoic acid export membrane protein
MRSLLAIGQTKALAIATAICAVANIILNIALVPWLGLNGSAMATLFSYFLLTVSTRFLIRNPDDRVCVNFSARIRSVAIIAACIGLGGLPVSIGFNGLRAAVILLAVCGVWFAWREHPIGEADRNSPNPARLAMAWASVRNGKRRGK